MRERYTIVIERGDHNFSAYAPDVLGCVTTGRTEEETARNMVEALEYHFRGIREDGDDLPPPLTQPGDVVHLAPDDVVTTVEVELPGTVAV